MATNRYEQPFTSLMAFAAAEDLRQIVVLTERASRKFANLTDNSRVALLIDDRENKGSDTQDSVAVTAIGEAAEADAGAALSCSTFISPAPPIWPNSRPPPPAPSCA